MWDAKRKTIDRPNLQRNWAISVQPVEMSTDAGICFTTRRRKKANQADGHRIIDGHGINRSRQTNIIQTWNYTNKSTRNLIQFSVDPWWGIMRCKRCGRMCVRVLMSVWLCKHAPACRATTSVRGRLSAPKTPGEIKQLHTRCLQQTRTMLRRYRWSSTKSPEIRKADGSGLVNVKQKTMNCGIVCLFLEGRPDVMVVSQLP